MSLETVNQLDTTEELNKFDTSIFNNFDSIIPFINYEKKENTDIHNIFKDSIENIDPNTLANETLGSTSAHKMGILTFGIIAALADIYVQDGNIDNINTPSDIIKKHSNLSSHPLMMKSVNKFIEIYNLNTTTENTVGLAINSNFSSLLQQFKNSQNNKGDKINYDALTMKSGAFGGAVVGALSKNKLVGVPLGIVGGAAAATLLKSSGASFSTAFNAQTWENGVFSGYGKMVGSGIQGLGNTITNGYKGLTKNGKYMGNFLVNTKDSIIDGGKSMFNNMNSGIQSTLPPKIQSINGASEVITVISMITSIGLGYAALKWGGGKAMKTKPGKKLKKNKKKAGTVAAIIAGLGLLTTNAVASSENTSSEPSEYANAQKVFTNKNIDQSKINWNKTKNHINPILQGFGTNQKEGINNDLAQKFPDLTSNKELQVQLGILKYLQTQEPYKSNPSQLNTIKQKVISELPTEYQNNNALTGKGKKLFKEIGIIETSN